MAHRKVRSLGSVPFSWEEMPGVPKQSGSKVTDQRKSMKIISPPPPGRSPSIKKKIMWGLQDPDPDPFAKAIKECTKSYRATDAAATGGGAKEGSSILCFGSINPRHKKKLLSLSCKKSSYDNVEKGNFVNLTMKQQQQQHRHVSSRPRDRRIAAGAINDDIGSGFKSDGSDKPLFISLLK